MEENEKMLCSSCGAEMQEFRGKYFCLACGNEYESVTNDLGEKDIILVSGNPLRSKVNDKDIKDNTQNLAENESNETEYATSLESDEPQGQKEGGNVVRGIIIGALAGIISLGIIIFAISMFNGSDPQKENNDVGQVVVDDEKEDEPTPTPTATPTAEPTATPTPTPNPTPTPTPKPTPTPTPKPTPTPTATSNSEQTGTLYRVRTSADDASTQLGAFRNLESAKELADQNKSNGYRVYDQDGKLVYKP